MSLDGVVESPSCLFDPSICKISQEKNSLADCIIQSVLTCDHSLHPMLFANIYLCGGTADTYGIQVRLRQEIVKQLKEKHALDHQVGVFLNKEPQMCAWRGASNLRGMEMCKVFASQNDYHEYGSEFCERYFI